MGMEWAWPGRCRGRKRSTQTGRGPWLRACRNTSQEG